MKEIFESADAFGNIVATLVRDYDTGKMPKGSESNFPDLWKNYMKDLGKELGLKGKALFHPVRLAISGRMSGPDLGDQLTLLHLAEGTIAPSFPLVSLNQRIGQLKNLSITEAKQKVDQLSSV